MHSLIKRNEPLLIRIYFRPDHILQDLRAKIFPLKRKRDKDTLLPARRKERSISSLVVNTPRVVSAQTGKRTTKSLMRKDVRVVLHSLREV